MTNGTLTHDETTRLADAARRLLALYIEACGLNDDEDAEIAETIESLTGGPLDA